MTQQQPRSLPVSPIQNLVNAVWPYLSGKQAIIVLAIGIVAAGLALNWSWLVAAGVAPLLLAVLPCAAMCALGLCMNKPGGGSGAGNSNLPSEHQDGGRNEEEE